MLIRLLKLENIRSYKMQEITFPEGSVLLSGDIGSGKSTILLSLEFALFGILKGQLSGSELLRHGAKTGSVELHFIVNNKEVIIKRELKRDNKAINQGTGFVIVDGIKTEGTPVELKTHVLNLLGYPKEMVTQSKALIFRFTVYTPQEQMKAILYESEEQRIDTLRKIFGIDKYKRVKENAILFLKDIKMKKNELKGIVQGLSGIKKDNDDAVLRLNDCKKKRKELEPKIKVIEKEKGKVQEELLVQEKKVKDLELIQKKIELIENNSANLFKRNKELKDESFVLQNEIDGLREELLKIKIEDIAENEDFVEEKIKSLSKKIEEIRSKKITLEKDLINIEREMTDIEKRGVEQELNKEIFQKTKERLLEIEKQQKAVLGIDIDTLRENERIIQIKINELLNKEKLSKEIIGNIVSLSTCPLCKQDVPHTHKEHLLGEENQKIAHSRKEIIVKELQLIEIKKDILEAKEEERKSQQLKVESAKLETLLANLSQNILRGEEAKKRSAELLKKHNSIKFEILNLIDTKESEEQIEHFKSIQKLIIQNKMKQQQIGSLLKTIEDKEARILANSKSHEGIKVELSRLNQAKILHNFELKSLSSSMDEVVKIKKLLEGLRKEETDLKVIEGSLVQEENDCNRQIESLRRQLSMLEKAEKDSMLLSQNQKWIEEFFINLIETIERNVMKQIYHEFNSLFVKWFELLMSDETITAHLDSSFSPIISQNGYDTQIENLSGGEKTSLALAYRLSLNKVINDLMTGIKTSDLIILDEPTDGFSTEQLDKVREVLEELDMKQIIIVSHEQKMESFVQNIIRINKQEHVSRAVKD